MFPDPAAWHQGYAGNNEATNQTPVEKFVASTPSEIQSQSNELNDRITETRRLVRVAETDGEKYFWEQELSLLIQQLHALGVPIKIAIQ
jgi:hypothetical protein